MSAYILIVVSIACGGSSCTHEWSEVTMQRFSDAEACQFASIELSKLTRGDVRYVCVPEKSK